MENQGAGLPDDPVLREILAGAADLPLDQRQAYLDGACPDPALRQEVESLIAALDRAGGLLSSPTLNGQNNPASGSAEMHDGPGTRIGHYKLLQQIGEGGFGVVFMAEQQQPVRRTVALEIIKLGMDTKQVVARFEAERQALALMDHPSIARVFDGGSTESGRPYFVMELVRGTPLIAYCDKHQLGMRDRLSLFVQVCQAVQHAHQKGIIHRDLKPSNVLVTVADGKPVPKVIDFGIAKAVSQKLTEKTLFTEFRQLVGTPQYMSPEQAEADGSSADVDTRSDVYSLGVLLYELLTGTTPLDAQELRSKAYAEMQRMIREAEPPAPSTRLSTMNAPTLSAIAASRKIEPGKLGRLVRGELDWIVMKALEKERNRRYETAIGLGHDVDRYLANQPVEACPPSWVYSLRKIARRNRAAMFTTTTIAVALVLATTVSSWQAVRATHAEGTALDQKRRADEQAAIARAANHFLGDVVSAPDPVHLLGDGVTVLQATRYSIERVDSGALKGQPLVEAAVRSSFGKTLRNLGRYDEAMSNLKRALELRRKFLPPGDPDVAMTLNELAWVCRGQGHSADAEPMAREALSMLRNALPADHVDIAPALDTLARLVNDQKRTAEAEPLAREALAIRRKALPARSADIAESLNTLGLLLKAQGDLAGAERLHREALNIYRATLPGSHWYIAISLTHLGSTLQSQGKLKEAESLYREALDICRLALPPGHPHIANCLGRIALVLDEQGELAEAEPFYRQALEISRRALPPGNSEIVWGLTSLGSVLRDQGKYVEAEPLLREALDVCRRFRSSSDPVTEGCLLHLALLLEAQEDFGDLEPLVREALQMQRQRQARDDWSTATSTSLQGVVLSAQRKFDDAEQWLLQGQRQMERESAWIPLPQRRATVERLVSLYESWGKPAEAVKWRAKLPATRPATAETP